jgi:hypothetical protein
MKENKPWLTLDTAKDALNSAPGFRYDREAMTWKPERFMGDVNITTAHARRASGWLASLMGVEPSGSP